MINKLISFFTAIFFFLLPIYFLPFSAFGVDVDKQALLFCATLTLFFLFLLKTTADKKISLVKTPFDLLLIILATLFVASVFISSPNKIASLISPMTAGTIVAGTVLYFLLVQNINNRSSYLFFLIGSSMLVSAFTIINQLKLIPAIAEFNPLGPLLTTVSFLLPVAVFIGSDLLVNHLAFLAKPLEGPKSFFSRISKKRMEVLFSVLSFLIILSAVFISAFHLLTDQKPLFLPFSFAWIIMMEVYKSIQNFLFGVGPGNYSFAFSIGKPASINLTPFWNINVSSSSSFLLNILVEAGILSFIFFAAIILKAIRLLTDESYQKASYPYLIGLIVAIAWQVFLPSNVALFALTIILLAFAAPKEKSKVQIALTRKQSLLLLLSGVVIVGALSYYQSRFFLSDLFYKKAIASASQQKVGEALQFSQEAINMNPYLDRNFSLSSSISLALASNISQNLSKSPDATEGGKQIQLLTQQAVNHAKMAVELNRLNSENWGLLANVYQNLIGGVEGSEQLTLDALNQQSMLNPASPLPKLAAGNLFFSAKQYNQAQSLYAQAANLKPDWNIAHYQLAQVYQQAGMFEQAANELQQTINLTSPDSKEYKMLQQELDKVKEAASPSASLKTSPPPAGGPTSTPKPAKKTTEE